MNKIESYILASYNLYDAVSAYRIHSRSFPMDVPYNATHLFIAHERHFNFPTICNRGRYEFVLQNADSIKHQWQCRAELWMFVTLGRRCFKRPSSVFVNGIYY